MNAHKKFTEIRGFTGQDVVASELRVARGADGDSSDITVEKNLNVLANIMWKKFEIKKFNSDDLLELRSFGYGYPDSYEGRPYYTGDFVIASIRKADGTPFANDYRTVKFAEDKLHGHMIWPMDEDEIDLYNHKHGYGTDFYIYQGTKWTVPKPELTTVKIPPEFFDNTFEDMPMQVDTISTIGKDRNGNDVFIIAVDLCNADRVMMTSKDANYGNLMNYVEGVKTAEVRLDHTVELFAREIPEEDILKVDEITREDVEIKHDFDPVVKAARVLSKEEQEEQNMRDQMTDDVTRKVAVEVSERQVDDSLRKAKDIVENTATNVQGITDDTSEYDALREELFPSYDDSKRAAAERKLQEQEAINTAQINQAIKSGEDVSERDEVTEEKEV